MVSTSADGSRETVLHEASHSERAERRPYSSPQIVDYGTVRALGGSAPGSDSYEEEEQY
jgi:hypothetical protein